MFVSDKKKRGPNEYILPNCDRTNTSFLRQIIPHENSTVSNLDCESRKCGLLTIFCSGCQICCIELEYSSLRMQSTCRPLFSTAAIILIDVKLSANHLLVMFFMRHKLVCKDPAHHQQKVYSESYFLRGKGRNDILSPLIILQHIILYSWRIVQK